MNKGEVIIMAFHQNYWYRTEYLNKAYGYLVLCFRRDSHGLNLFLPLKTKVNQIRIEFV